MNERIRELWDKAAKSIAAYPSGQNNSWETQVNFLDKFAQLIVQECADLFEVEWGDEKLTGNDVGYVVKKHFGIEP